MAQAKGRKRKRLWKKWFLPVENPVECGVLDSVEMVDTDFRGETGRNG
jgi:hypothetical protein